MITDAASRREQAREAWLSFVHSRLQDAASDAPNHIEALDCELELVDEFAAHIRARRNACTWPSRLPVELLSSIFAILQRTWTPEMTRRRRIHHDVATRQSYFGTEEEYDPETHSVEYCSYDVGWVNLTHVCAAWRKIALATPALWSDFNCSDLHTSFGAVIAERSGNQPDGFCHLPCRAYNTSNCYTYPKAL
ncbi:hypothetical protein PENSPDRAFT_99707 [Peniophora sp. CONT]|nr:hypothetical protein PENSPDRAFT_99707 [Peniophora sp. CONT]